MVKIKGVNQPLDEGPSIIVYKPIDIRNWHYPNLNE